MFDNAGTWDIRITHNNRVLKFQLTESGRAHFERGGAIFEYLLERIAEEFPGVDDVTKLGRLPDQTLLWVAPRIMEEDWSWPENRP